MHYSQWSTSSLRKYSLLYRAFFKFNSILLYLFIIFSLSLSSILHASEVSNLKRNLYAYPKMYHVSDSDEYKYASVSSVIEDDSGIIWFGIFGGLARFDGYQTKLFTAGKEEHHLSNGVVTAIAKDRLGNLWVGTQKGLNRFVPKTETFKQYYYQKDNVASINNDYVDTLYVDMDGILWIGTRDGVCRYDAKTDKFKRISLIYPHEALEIQSIDESEDGTLWLVSPDDGLFSYNKEKQVVTFHNLEAYFKVDHKVKINYVTATKSKQLLITSDHGIFSLDIETKKIESMSFTFDYDSSTSFKDAYYIFSSRNGTIWFGDSMKGLCEYKRNSIESINCFNPGGIQERIKSIDFIYEDSKGIIWLATGTSGLMYFDPNNPFQLIHFNKPNDHIQKIEQDNERNLWIGTGAGLVKMSPQKKIKIFRSDNEKSNSLDSDSIYSLSYHPEENMLWIGSSKGLHYYDSIKQEIRQVNLSDSISDTRDYGFLIMYREQSDVFYLPSYNKSYVFKWQPVNKSFTKVDFGPNISKELTWKTPFKAFVDSQNRLWIVGFQFIGYLDTDKNQFIGTEFQSGSARYYISMAEDKQGNLWVADLNGVYKLDDEGKIIQTEASSQFGDGDSMFYAIISSDQDHNLWIGSSKGLWQFNIEKGSIRHFTQYDGLQGNDFSESTYIDSNGYIYMGGTKGISVFHPSKVEKAFQQKVKTQLTDFLVNNKSVEIGDLSPDLLNTAIRFQSQITLSADQSQLFSIEFSSLDYTAAEGSKYAYRLVGYNNDWIFTDAKNRRASYTSVPAGEYTFEVKAANSQGIWNDDSTQIKIKIIAPWWLTYWAYSLYIVLFMLAVFTFTQYRIKMIQRRADNLEEQVTQRTYLIKQQRDQLEDQNSQLESVSKAKSQFFTNISHEFRTPLTLSIEPLKKVLKGNRIVSEKDKKFLKLALKNNIHMLDLLGQVLDINRLEAGKMPVKKVQVNLVKLVLDCVERFRIQASESSITFKTIGFDEPEVIQQAMVEFDQGHLEKIILNLLSNAIKFSPVNSSIEIGLSSTSKNIVVWVKDQGPGIAEKDQRYIFERYFQVSETVNNTQPGTGIGLALVKELVQLHSATIEVLSEPSHGACFTLTIKKMLNNQLSEEFQQDDFPLINPLEHTDSFNQSVIDFSDIEINDVLDNASTETDKPKLLLIEDNLDLQNFIVDSLSRFYHMIVESNGEDGLNRAIDEIPDLIISDIMMPKMDGYDVVKGLRQHEMTSHIPVVLLTAKGDRESRLKGWYEKADEYLTKPFDIEELKIRLNNLLEIRNILKQRFSKNIFNNNEEQVSNIEPDLFEGKNLQQREFAERLNSVLEKNYTEPSISIAYIASQMNVSERQLFRKLGSILDMTPAEYLRNFRLEKSLTILLQGKSVSYAAFEAGFSSQSYFGKCFKAYYGMSPGEYKKTKKL